MITMILVVFPRKAGVVASLVSVEPSFTVTPRSFIYDKTSRWGCSLARFSRAELRVQIIGKKNGTVNEAKII